MELRRIIISEVDDHQVIILKEVDGERSFPPVRPRAELGDEKE